ncbi:hypothetical protein ACLKA7_002449 [Drosophila subpalustris]
MMDNSEQPQRQQNALAGLPPLPKSLSAAATTIGPGLPSGHGHVPTPLRSHTSSPAASVATLTAATGDLYLGPSTSSAARNRNYNGHGRHGSLSSTQESLSDRESVHSRASSTHSASGSAAQHPATATPTNSCSNGSTTIDNQLAILRREMYGLRQLDLSLLSQLWALNESIQGFRVFLQEQDALSPPSRSRTPSDANSLSSDEDDGSYAPVAVPKLNAPPAAIVASLASPAASGGLPTKLATGSTTSHASTSSTSGASGSSSAASSMGKHHHHHQQQQLQQQQQQQQQLHHQQQMPHYHHQQHHHRSGAPPAPPAQHKAHPQLPRILQQRMRHAPPPPPPTRPGGGGGASSSSSNHSISSVTQQQQQQQQQLHPHHQRNV